MKKRRLFRSHFLALLAFLCCSPGLHAAIWSGGAVADVTDEDLVLDSGGGNIILPLGGTTINAQTTDILVTVPNSNVTVTASNSGESQLYMCVAADRTITFDLSDGNDLTFLGSSTGASLLMIVSGEGRVQFILPGGRTVSFTSDGMNHGPTLVYVLMQEVDEYTEKPTLAFKRIDYSPEENEEDVTIAVGPDSCISYLSSTGVVDGGDAGCIEFNPTNQGDGRMILDLADCSSFIIAGHYTNQAVKTSITTASIDRSIASGDQAIMVIVKEICDEYDQTPHGCLLVVNRNSKCFDLLIDPFCTTGAKTDTEDYNGSFNGIRYGFVLGANGVLDITDGACLDYVGLTNNICPCVEEIGIVRNTNHSVSEDTCDCGDSIKQMVKYRNYSAFIVDGNYNPAARSAQIVLGEQSGVFFRSGVDAHGNVNSDLSDPCVFTVNPFLITEGAGELVFVVEGALEVYGQDTADTLNSRMEILSLHVDPFGGPLFPNGSGVMFPKRSFDTATYYDECEDAFELLKRYNKAAWMVNNVVSLFEVSIAHTDENHEVIQNNDVSSEATYIGGERWYLSALKCEDPLVGKPKIEFHNSRLHVHTDVAFAGLDLSVPNLVADDACIQNVSRFIFYSNGKAVDNGTGRNMILGTQIGAKACDDCTILCEDAHLDVIQDTECSIDLVDPADSNGDQTLMLNTDVNSMMTVEAIGGNDITGQRSIHVIYLGWNSNISIGADPDVFAGPFSITTTPELRIAGNFFTFETRGGSLGVPETSNSTGEGGIFVDANGLFSVGPNYRTSIGTMITKSPGGAVNLPKPQTFFDNRVGVADWKLDLTLQEETVLVGPDECYSDYTLNWITTTKDFANFCPYEIGDVTVNQCPEVTTENIASLPTFQGEVEQLQIVDSRIGDAIHVRIDGGHIREMLWLTCDRPAEAPVALVVIENGGRIGINTAHRNVDSIFAQTTLGVNGISFVANGSGCIDLNEDIIVNNICAFLKGPDFASDDVIEIYSDVPRVFRVTKDGILDFRSFNNGGIIRFAGEVDVVLEAGARIILGDADLEFADNTTITFETAEDAGAVFGALSATLGSIDNSIDPTTSVDAMSDRNEFSPIMDFGDGLRNTDAFRVCIIGEGTIRLKDSAIATIDEDAFVGVETLSEMLSDGELVEIATTDFTFEFQDNAKLHIGIGNSAEGGVFQVGNVENFTGHSVNFNLVLDGTGVEVVMGSGGFFGLGAGIVRACQPTQSEVFADTTFNVDNVTLTFNDGNLQFDRIFNSDDSRAHSFVIGDVANMTLDYQESGEDQDTVEEERLTNFAIHGGANFFMLTPGDETNQGAMALINREDDDVVEAPVTGSDPVTITRMRSGVLAASPELDEVDLFDISAESMFEALKIVETTSAQTRSTHLGTVAPESLFPFREARTQGRIVYVDRGMIGRQSFSDIIDLTGGTPEDRRSRAYDIGAVTVQIDAAVEAPGEALILTQIQ